MTQKERLRILQFLKSTYDGAVSLPADPTLDPGLTSLATVSRSVFFKMTHRSPGNCSMVDLSTDNPAEWAKRQPKE